MQQREEIPAVSARPAEMRFCKDAEIKETGTPLRLRQEL